MTLPQLTRIFLSKGKKKKKSIYIHQPSNKVANVRLFWQIPVKMDIKKKY